MQIYRDIAHLPYFKNAVITVGTFDGVHAGHQQIIKLLHTEAAAIHGETVVITFHPHPKMIITSTAHPIYVLNTLDEKIDLLRKHGVDHLVVVPFTDAFAEQTAEEYIKNFLVSNFHPHTIVIGHDHRFGALRKGNYQLLEDKAAEYGYCVKEIPKYILEDVTISSTRIREALLAGDIDTANKFLGYSYFFSGSVVEGNKLGRTIAFPTANLYVEDEHKLIPANGVYAVEVEVPNINKQLLGMMNIGIRPTIGEVTRVIEVNIFDFDTEIYKEKVKVYIKRYLRKEVKFKNLDELKNQLTKDKREALEYLRAI